MEWTAASFVLVVHGRTMGKQEIDAFIRSTFDSSVQRRELCWGADAVPTMSISQPMSQNAIIMTRVVSQYGLYSMLLTLARPRIVAESAPQIYRLAKQLLKEQSFLESLGSLCRLC